MESVRYYVSIGVVAISASFLTAEYYERHPKQLPQFSMPSIDVDKARDAAFDSIGKRIAPDVKASISQSFVCRKTANRIDFFFQIQFANDKSVTEWIVVTESFTDGVWRATYANRER